MQKKYSKLLLLPILSIVVFTCFSSCDKEKGTTWENVRAYNLDPIYHENPSSSINRVIRISFKAGKKADITCPVVYDEQLQVSYTAPQGNVNYILKGINITLKTKNTIDQNDDWTGEIVKDKMILENVFGETVEFRKIK